MRVGFIITLLGLGLVSSVASAQMHSASEVAAHPVAVTNSPPNSLRGASFTTRPATSRGHQPRILLGNPYFYSDYASEPMLLETPPPQIVVIQSPAAEAPQEARPEPLLIELQGDRYVRIGRVNASAKSSATSQQVYAATAPKAVLTRTPDAHAELSPVVLVYRDGHQEAIEDFVITNGIIYVRGDYWTDGYWTRKIHLTSLDMPATMRACEEHGAKLVLPMSPNEVVTRP